MAARKPSSPRRWSAWLLAAVLLAAGPAFAQAPAASAWSSLTPAQRTALAPLQRDWSRIDATRQQKWLEVANRFPQLPSDEQQRLQQRMVDWARLTPDQRGQARLNYRDARDIGAEERQARWQAYQALPPEEKRRLAERGEAPRDPGRGKPERDPGESSPKSNLVTAPPPAQARRVAPTMVQAPSGATTRLLSKPANPPLHQQTGLPKIAATPGFVDSSTLLPQRGAQGAAARGTPAPAASAARGK